MHAHTQGADTEARCRWTDMNALHYAVYFDAAEIVQVLAEQTPSLVMSTCSEFSHGTGLHMAATNLSLEAAKVLVSS
jgi:CAP-Gly domain-containing linker protein 3/4